MKISLDKIQRVKALIIKEFFQIIKDPSSILIAIVFPLILLFIYGYGISLDMDNLQVGLYMQDNSSTAQSFEKSLTNSQFFHIRKSLDEKELEKMLVAGDINGIIKIPFYFSEYKELPDYLGPIYVIGDGSSPNTAVFVQNYVLGAWQNWLVQQRISKGRPFIPGIQADPRFWYNEKLNSQYVLVPGSIAIIMTLIGTLLTSLVIAREWERGTMEALMTTPMTIQEFLFSKMFTYFFLGMGSMIFSTFLAIFLFNLPFRGSFFALFIVSSAFLIVALGTGLLISTISRSQFIASQISIISAFLPSFMLSGFIFEISSMPVIIRAITYLIPTKYMVSSIRTLFLAGTVYRLLFYNVMIMVIISIILLGATFVRSRKRLD